MLHTASPMSHCDVWHTYHTSMKTTLYLPDDLKQAVEVEARRRGISEAEVVRGALREQLMTGPVRPRAGIITGLEPIFDANEPQHEAVVEAIQSSRGPLIVSPYVIAELDYLVMTRHGVQAQRTVLNEIAGGAWELAHMDRARLADANRIVERFADIPIGVADASNVVLAEVYGTRAIVTLDRRHFTILRFDDGSRVDVRP